MEGEVLEANRGFYAAFEARDMEAIQFFLTEESVVVAGEAARVTLYENILQEVPGVGGGPGMAGHRQALGDARVAATNVFLRIEGQWRMVVHHGSPVAG